MDSSFISSIVIAIIAALVSVLSLVFTYFAARTAESRSAQAQLDKQLKKYSQPLLIAAFDLQQRLYELLEYPITDEALSCAEGKEDLEIFTSFRLARYLAAAHILREKTYYLSMQPASKRSWFRDLISMTRLKRHTLASDEEQKPATIERDNSASKVRDLLYKIDDELDRRRKVDGQNYGIFPGQRLLIAERMISTISSPGISGDEAGDEARVKSWDEFLKGWKDDFKEPCSWFVKWIEIYIDQRRSGVIKRRETTDKREYTGDDHFRCLQHLLCDVVRYCDLRGLYYNKGAGLYRKCGPSGDCDCFWCNPQSDVGERHDSRLNDKDMTLNNDL